MYAHADVDQMHGRQVFLTRAAALASPSGLIASAPAYYSPLPFRWHVAAGRQPAETSRPFVTLGVPAPSILGSRGL